MISDSMLAILTDWDKWYHYVLLIIVIGLIVFTKIQRNKQM